MCMHMCQLHFLEPDRCCAYWILGKVFLVSTNTCVERYITFLCYVSFCLLAMLMITEAILCPIKEGSINNCRCHNRMNPVSSWHCLVNEWANLQMFVFSYYLIIWSTYNSGISVESILNHMPGFGVFLDGEWKSQFFKDVRCSCNIKAPLEMWCSSLLVSSLAAVIENTIG